MHEIHPPRRGLSHGEYYADTVCSVRAFSRHTHGTCVHVGMSGLSGMLIRGRWLKQQRHCAHASIVTHMYLRVVICVCVCVSAFRFSVSAFI